MKKQLLTNWNLSRTIRFTLGIFVGIYAIALKEYVLLSVAGLFLVQSLFNISCCSANNCNTDDVKTKNKALEFDNYKPRKK